MSKKTTEKNIKPWEAKGLREDVIRTFNIRFTEIDEAKLVYIREHAPESTQQLCLRAVRKEIEVELKKIR